MTQDPSLPLPDAPSAVSAIVRPTLLTASFSTYQGAGRVSIARYPPRGTPAGFRVFRDLAPGTWFNSVEWEEYKVLYQREILDRLDPQATLQQLQGLAGDGNTPVLLCWEKPPFEGKNQCHRRLVAAWFTKHLGFEVPEREPEIKPIVPANGGSRLRRRDVTLKLGVGTEPTALEGGKK